NLASDRERILTDYFNRGFSNATLEIATSFPVPDRVDVTYTIHEGEKFSVDQVLVSGLDHTRDYVVDRELQIKSGDPLSQKGLLDTQSKLYDLGIFSQVDTAVQNPEGTDPQKHVLVQVREANRYTFTYGIGFEFQTGQPAGAAAGVSPRVGFDVTRLNFAGRNQTITFQSHVGRLQQRGLISYEVPKLFDSERFKLIFSTFYDISLEADFGRLLAQNSTYQTFGGKGKPNRQYVFARSTSIGLEQPVRGTRVLPPGSCPTRTSCAGIQLIPLPELFFAGGGNSHRGFGLNQAGPRDPASGFPVGGT